MDRRTVYGIEPVGNESVTELLGFVMTVRKEVFPMLNHEQLPEDLLHIQRHYLEPKDAAFFLARMEGQIVGSIAVHRYDDRIAEVGGRYDLRATAEIVKCYVDANIRRQGIGTALVQQALRFCRDAGYKTVYLHTHRFLPGAVSFWQQHGFLLRVEQGDSMQTVHMDRRV
ncbi:GNAT family N-acetyltransferase [Brevibacillus humidisoli]|uniref:GNAT family N-acetyltransferase n=1 Tax=Brevibacillus humidisoli TaxID=2895522 RepID=UPI001E619BB6|nr:GNAT family N-acetyltransferase [Brevibacillus humidisoli]UFJ41831.1 GNAT family N-acetyltransferase [Brevibacillus humidisoli]